MWVKIGSRYLNLDNVVDAILVRDDNGIWTATAETISGHVKHYHDLEAEDLKRNLDLLAAGPTQQA